VLLLSVLDNGLDVKGLDVEMKQAVIGAVFIAAASVDFIRRRLRRRATEGMPAGAVGEPKRGNRIKASVT
jgi:hypothetical protein